MPPNALGLLPAHNTHTDTSCVYIKYLHAFPILGLVPPQLDTSRPAPLNQDFLHVPATEYEVQRQRGEQCSFSHLCTDSALKYSYRIESIPSSRETSSQLLRERVSF